MIFILAATLSLSLAPSFAFAADFTVEGRLYDLSNIPLSSTDVTIMLDLVDDSNTACVLFREVHTGLNVASPVASAVGTFAVRMGSGTQRYLGPLTLSGVFANGSIPGVLASDMITTCNATATATTHRHVKIKVWDSVGGGVYAIASTPDADPNWDALAPDTVLTTVPVAMVAHYANTLQGHTASDFLLTNTNTDLLQSNVDNIFSLSNYTKLTALLSTTPPYISATPLAAVDFNAQKLSNVANPTNPQDAATKSYADSRLGGAILDVTGTSTGVGNGMTLSWNATLNKWTASASSGVSLVAAGNGLSGGNITANGTLSVDVGTTANKILQLDPFAKIPAVDGSLLTNVNATQLQTRTVSAVAPTSGQVIGWNALSTLWEPITPAGGTITALTGDVAASGTGSVAATIQPNAVNQSSKINNVGNVINRLLITNATDGSTVGYSVCNVGEVLQWTLSGWACTAVSTMLGTSGVAAGTYGNATQVPRLGVDSQGRVIALTNVNIAFPVTSVAGRNGDVVLTAADITSGLGSAASKDVGTGAGNVVMLNATPGLPALDGSLLTGVAQKAQANTFSVGNQTINLAAGTETGLTIHAANSQSASLLTLTNNTNVSLYTANPSGNPGLSTDLATKSYVDTTATGVTLAGDVSGTPGANVVDKIKGKIISATPNATGQILIYDGTSQFTPVALSGDATMSSSGAVTLASVGSATSYYKVTTDIKGRVTSGNTSLVAADLPSISTGLTGTLPVTNGGTGLSTAPSSGQILIGNGSSYTLNLISGASNQINVSSGAGTITLSTPQSLNTSAAIKFASAQLNNSILGGVERLGVNNHATLDNSASAMISTGNNSNKGLVIQGNAISQIGNLQEWQSYNGTVLSFVDPSGKLHGDGSQLTGVTATPAGNTGEVQFNWGSTLTSNPSFYWDNSLFRLGLNTTAPQSKLDVAGGVGIGSYAGVFGAPANGLIVSGPTGIGTSNPTGSNANNMLDVAGLDKNVWLQVENDDSTANRFPKVQVTNFMGSSGLSGMPALALSNNRGNLSSPLGLGTNDPLGVLEFRGGDGSLMNVLSGSIGSQATEIWGASAHGSKINFSTTPNGSTTPGIRMIIDQNGYVAVGNSTPRAALDVSTGSIVGRAGQSNGGSTIDFSTGNSQYTNSNCGGFTFNNMKDGGNYLFAVKGTTTTTCSFTAYSDVAVTSLTVHMPPDNGPTATGKHTLFTLAVIGLDVYVSWTPGY